MNTARRVISARRAWFRPARLAWLTVPWLCWTTGPAWADSAVDPQYWTTIPDVAVGGDPGSPTALARISGVRVNASGTEIVIRHSGRRTVWDVANLDEPVREFERAQRSTPNPPEGWVSTAILPDGTRFAREQYPPPAREFTWEPDHPGWQIPVAHLRFAEGSWIADTLAMHDASGAMFAVRVGRSQVFAQQPFGDYDLLYFDARQAVAGFVERRGGAGGVRLVEIAPRGDTVLEAWIPVPEVPLARARAQQEIVPLVEAVEDNLRRSRIDTLSAAEVRAIVEEALHIPDGLPLVTEVVPTISNEVWLRSSERSDSAAVWYVLDRSDPDAPPRQVLLPEWFVVSDATRTHVWGLRRDASWSGQVHGRRLVPP